MRLREKCEPQASWKREHARTPLSFASCHQKRHHLLPPEACECVPVRAPQDLGVVPGTASPSTALRCWHQGNTMFAQPGTLPWWSVLGLRARPLRLLLLRPQGPGRGLEGPPVLPPELARFRHRAQAATPLASIWRQGMGQPRSCPHCVLHLEKPVRQLSTYIPSHTATCVHTCERQVVTRRLERETNGGRGKAVHLYDPIQGPVVQAHCTPGTQGPGHWPPTMGHLAVQGEGQGPTGSSAGGEPAGPVWALPAAAPQAAGLPVPPLPCPSLVPAWPVSTASLLFSASYMADIPPCLLPQLQPPLQVGLFLLMIPCRIMFSET